MEGGRGSYPVALLPERGSIDSVKNTASVHSISAWAASKHLYNVEVADTALSQRHQGLIWK